MHGKVLNIYPKQMSFWCSLKFKGPIHDFKTLCLLLLECQVISVYVYEMTVFVSINSIIVSSARVH